MGLSHSGDQSEAESAAELQEFSSTLSRIADALAQLARLQGLKARWQDREAAIEPEAVRSLIQARRIRDELFPSDLFGEPAWDMLLDLFAARLEGQDVRISNLCISAAVPPTTALRYVGRMESLGLIRRIAGSPDARQIFVELTDRSAEAMEVYFRKLKAVSPLIE